MNNLETVAILHEVAQLDPTLLSQPETYEMIEIGADFINEVTREHGTPAQPKWHTGSRESTYMTYHNGESGTSQGHTSADIDGAGVPRNVLIITDAIHAVAGREIIPAASRARLFGAACAHDVVQLCGRSSIYANGDEEQSANRLDHTLKEAGYDEAYRKQAVLDVTATTFHPTNGTQIIDNRQPAASILEQQIIACADLLSPTTPRGTLGAFEWALEELGLPSQDRILHERMIANGVRAEEIAHLGAFVAFVESDEPLRLKAAASLAEQANFHTSFSYSDELIQAACGSNIDQLFPGRERTVSKLQAYGAAALAGDSLVTLWEDAHNL